MEEDISEIEESKGVLSNIRITVKSMRRLAWFCVVAGVFLGFAMLLRNRYELVPLALALVIGGPFASAGTSAAKSYQTNNEGKDKQEKAY